MDGGQQEGLPSRQPRQRRDSRLYLSPEEASSQSFAAGPASASDSFSAYTVQPPAAFGNGFLGPVEGFAAGSHGFPPLGHDAYYFQNRGQEPYGNVGYGFGAGSQPVGLGIGARGLPGIGSLPAGGQGPGLSQWQTGRPGPAIGTSSSKQGQAIGASPAKAGPAIGTSSKGSSQAGPFGKPGPQIGQSSKGPQIGQSSGRQIGSSKGGPAIGTSEAGLASGAPPGLPRNLIGTADALPSLARRSSFNAGAGAIGQVQPATRSNSAQRMIGSAARPLIGSSSFLQPEPVAHPESPWSPISSAAPSRADVMASAFPSGMSAQRGGLRGDEDESGAATTSYAYPAGYRISPAGTAATEDSIPPFSNLSLTQSLDSFGRVSGPLSGQKSAASPVANSQAVSKVKVICSHGGRFTRVPGGGFEYEGGETRLVSVANNCSYKALVDALERVAGTVTHTSNGSDRSGSEQGASLRFQLPSEPNTYVDLIDDEDVQLMFDEWADYTQKGRHATAKLHIFVDLQRASSNREGQAGKARGSTGSTDATPVMRGTRSPLVSGNGSPGFAVHHNHYPRQDGPPSAPQPPQEEEALPPQPPAQQNQRASTGSGVSQTPRLNLQDISDRLEIISPEDVTLVKFLGAGGYGEVYLGKWHSSEAAIKCLNPSLFNAGGDGGHVSHAAMVELIREAEILGSLRHPNVVWVYGVVLPRVSDDGEAEMDHLCEDSVDIAALTAVQGGGAHARGQPGVVRPPAIVTEFLSQGSLRGVLSRKSDLLQGALVRVLIAMDAAKGMEYLHSKKIVHFDLKSANLLLGYRDRRAICKVADFGLSKQKRETYVSGVSSQRGTLPWIAPEIIKTPHAVTEKVDVFSFGVVLWELWTGREPYEGLNYHALLHQITTSPTTMRPVLPGTKEWEATGDPSPPEPCAGYQELVEQCWGDVPSARPSFREIVASLRTMAAALRPARRSSALGLPGGAAQAAGADASPQA